MFKDIYEVINKLTLIYVLLICTGCSSYNNYSANTALNKIKHSAYVAISDPFTYVPVASAYVFYATNLDNSVSKWASNKKPIYTNFENAFKASNDYRDFLTKGAFFSAALAPFSINGKKNPSKLKNLVVDRLGLETAFNIKNFAKDRVYRKRPDNKPSDNYRGKHNSFPSGHATGAFGAARIISNNLNLYDLSDMGKYIIKTGVFTFAGVASWGRVEAKLHYPSDVLIGAAIGNIVNQFFHHLFIKEDSSIYFNAKKLPKGGLLTLKFIN